MSLTHRQITSVCLCECVLRTRERVATHFWVALRDMKGSTSFSTWKTKEDPKEHLGGGNSKKLYFHLYLGKIPHFWRLYFSDGLVQPPTRTLIFDKHWGIHRFSETPESTLGFPQKRNKSLNAGEPGEPSLKPTAKIAPENGWLEDDRFLLAWPIFRASC